MTYEVSEIKTFEIRELKLVIFFSYFGDTFLKRGAHSRRQGWFGNKFCRKKVSYLRRYLTKPNRFHFTCYICQLENF